MASQPPGNQLPLLYKNIVPLSSEVHPKHGLVGRTSFPEAVNVHAVPITVDEFTNAQRYYPIVFNVGESPTPLALMGLNEGINLFVDADGNWAKDVYIPAYFRRYPFILGQLNQGSDQLSLLFDQDSPLIKDGEGDPLFDGKEPTEVTKNILGFCEQYEQSVQRTRAFVEEVTKLKLFTDGEVTIQQQGVEQPSVYRGFQMIAEDKLRETRGDQARKMVQNGMLGLIFAHLFSLSSIRELFEKQMARGGVVPPTEA